MEGRLQNQPVPGTGGENATAKRHRFMFEGDPAHSGNQKCVICVADITMISSALELRGSHDLWRRNRN